MEEPLRGRRVVVHVGASVAAFKAAPLVSGLRRAGADVRVAMTRDARRFIGAATLQALSGHPVTTSLWARRCRRGHEDPAAQQQPPVEGEDGMPHLELGAWGDCQVAVAASANLIARLAHGLADDAVTATVLASRAPLLVAPAMEAAMWEHPATAANVDVLRRRGVELIGPVEGHHASGICGPGRMAEPADIVTAVCARVGAAALVPVAGAEPAPEPRGALGAPTAGETWLRGRRVVVTAGGTREPIDPIRFLGNRSSGRMGTALALDALALGADVTLITTAELPEPHPALTVVRVDTAAEMLRAVEAAMDGAGVLLMAAAVADHRPTAVAREKLKMSGMPGSLALEPTVDVLERVRELPARRGAVVVGFAAETESLIANAEAKLRRKGLDLIVANVVGNGVGMGTEDNAVTIIGADGSQVAVERRSKSLVARAVLEAVRPLLR